MDTCSRKPSQTPCAAATIIDNFLETCPVIRGGKEVKEHLEKAAKPEIIQIEVH